VRQVCWLRIQLVYEDKPFCPWAASERAVFGKGGRYGPKFVIGVLPASGPSDRRR
jgi:hypothetical protein